VKLKSPIVYGSVPCWSCLGLLAFQTRADTG